MVVLQSISFANYALTTKTTNIIYGSAPYLTFDGGRTRVTNTAALLRISLSDGRKFTPATNNSSFGNPIVLPVAGQSFNDIGMLVPRNTNSIALSSLIGTPYNYWGDDDGDGQGVNGVTATGSLNLSIYDKDGFRVARNEVLTICRAPYRLTLSNSEGRLTTRYGVPNESRFSAGNATYYINPKAAPVICYARSSLGYSTSSPSKGLSATVFEPGKGFLPQSVTPSSYGLNFPTTGANNLDFYLDIGGVSQALSWATVSHGGITATMTDSTRNSVRVTLTGPVAPLFQWGLYPPRIDKPSLPQVFELVGRDSSGNAVVKYGFKLKQWFVNAGASREKSAIISSFCNRLGYRLPNVKDLTNAYCLGLGGGSCQGATPSSPDNSFRRHIGAGFFTEWGVMTEYPNAGFFSFDYYLTNDYYQGNAPGHFLVASNDGHVVAYYSFDEAYGVCVYP
ncbi:hypothetical protein [Gilliamella apis]|uniref:hypothetical protein n=1 Tax=Gilliamella apis TaxID=1970738 RepID=UPI0010564D2D|nr:hypothetical protein [Gilliamella apis]